MNPDILLTYNWPTLDWALANAISARRAHIHHEDGFNLDEAERQFARRIAYRRLCLLANDLLIVPSHNLYGIARGIWRRPGAKVRLIPNGIEWHEFGAEPGVGRSSDRSSVTVLGTVAPLRPEKNIGALLRAAAVLQSHYPIELVIVGDGSERGRLEGLATELGVQDNCQFQGLRHDVAAALAPIDIFVMTSKTEQMPTSLLQAMAVAKPVVAYDVGDVAQMVSDENAPFVVPRDDEQALVQCVETLIKDPSLRREIGQRNRARVKHRFDASTMFERYTACYLHVLTTKR